LHLSHNRGACIIRANACGRDVSDYRVHCFLVVTTNSMDQLRATKLCEFRAQAAHMSLDDVRARVEVKIPHRFEQHCARDNAVRVAREIFQKPSAL
jgi:hypothetical protein